MCNYLSLHLHKCLFYFILKYYIYKKETKNNSCLFLIYIFIYKRKYFLPAKLKIFSLKIKEARLNLNILIIYENNQKIII
nr:MAG TPA: hypothetical protein [Caudoviricetes sp.]